MSHSLTRVSQSDSLCTVIPNPVVAVQWPESEPSMLEPYIQSLIRFRPEDKAVIDQARAIERRSMQSFTVNSVLRYIAREHPALHLPGPAVELPCLHCGKPLQRSTDFCRECRRSVSTGKLRRLHAAELKQRKTQTEKGESHGKPRTASARGAGKR